MPDYTKTEAIQEIRLSQQEELQEMMGNPPGWILYSGISIISMVTVVVILLSWFIKYPDKMEAPIVIRTERAPTEILTPLSGILDSIFIADSEYVDEGTLLALIRNASSLKDIQEVEEKIDQLMQKENQSFLTDFLLSENLVLGELQNPYAQVSQALKELQFYLKNPSVTEQRNALRKEVEQIKQLNHSLQEQESIYSQEVALTQKDYERSLSLYRDSVISEQELENKKSEWLSEKRNLEQMRTSQIQNNIRIEQLIAQKDKLHRDKENGEINKKLSLQQQCESLKGEIQKWKQQYLIVAPVSGEIVFQAGIENKMAFTAGKVLFTILPEQKENTIYAYCDMPVTGAGKIVKGNTAHIYLDEWPYKEYGIIEAQVEKIAAMAQKTGDGYHYNVRLSLPFCTKNTPSDSIRTTYGEAIPFHQNMTGSASIITEDKSILERVFSQILDLVKNN